MSPEDRARELFDALLAELDWGARRDRKVTSHEPFRQVVGAEPDVQKAFARLALAWRPEIEEAPTWRQISGRADHRLEVLGALLGELLSRRGLFADADLVAMAERLGKVEPVLDPVAEREWTAKKVAELGIEPLSLGIDLPKPSPEKSRAVDQALTAAAALGQQPLPVDDLLEALEARLDASSPPPAGLREALEPLVERLRRVAANGEPDEQRTLERATALVDEL